jgi:hypothetical protein
VFIRERERERPREREREEEEEEEELKRYHRSLPRLMLVHSRGHELERERERNTTIAMKLTFDGTLRTKQRKIWWRASDHIGSIGDAIVWIFYLGLGFGLSAEKLLLLDLLRTDRRSVRCLAFQLREWYRRLVERHRRSSARWCLYGALVLPAHAGVQR